MTKIYLISPPKIDNLQEFYQTLGDILQTKLVPVFQLRLKNYNENEVEEIALKTKEICDKNNCLFIINDFVDLALKIKAQGVHVGADDGNIKEIREKSPKNFVIGASCYDSKDLAVKADEDGADYVSFGAFFETKTKKSKGKPQPELITWCSELMSLPIVTIGGINDDNCKILQKSGADFIAVISYVWNYEGGAVKAINNLHLSLNSN
jgi:thiamine-phosphate pyrophosphorylase